MNNHKTIVIWDFFVRIFHWVLVLLVGLAFLTGDENNRFHAYAAYAVLLLISLRLVWGLIGSQHARFANFITAPGVAIEYLKGVVRGRPGYYLGHNPAAAWMVVALLLALLLVSATGYLAQPTQNSVYATAAFTLVTPAMADDDNDHRGKKSGSEFWEHVHEAGAGLLLALIGLHVLGALVSSLLHRENLVKSMITGRKIRRE